MSTLSSRLSLSDGQWVIRYDEFCPELEGRREALCALGNGYFVTRGALSCSEADDVHSPGTYVAGIYNRLEARVAGHLLDNEDLVNLPNWLYLKFRIGQGGWFDLGNVQILAYKQELNLKEGIHYRDIYFKDNEGRETTIAERRFVHMRYFHLAGLELSICAHNWSGSLTIRSALDGSVVNGIGKNRSPDRKNLEPVDSMVIDGCLSLKMRTTQSHIIIAQAARMTVFHNGHLVATERNNVIEPSFVGEEVQLAITPNDRTVLQKVVALFTSRDHAISEPALAAYEAVTNAPEFEELVSGQIEAWRHLWYHFDLELESDSNDHTALTSLLLRLNSFHVLQTASANSMDLDAGIPARGWSEGYQGHVFWDDLFVFPFLLLRMPSIAQSLLKYRYRRLDEARKIAREMGLAGARYPWQSASTGREETPKGSWDAEKGVWRPELSHMQVHVNAAIAFNIWQYYQVTGNVEFMCAYGADMLLEIARFFAHFARYNTARDRYEIHAVVGPDEFHTSYPQSITNGINNNAYTNLMAVWTIARALDLLNLLPEDHSAEICERLKLTRDEIADWDRVSRKMYVPLLENGIISQFEGYEDLDEFPRTADGSIDLVYLNDVLAKQGGWANQYQISKQADVLMLFYLFSSEELKELFDRLGYTFSPESIPANVAYYVQQTANSSTLSRVATAWVLSRVDRPNAWGLLTNISGVSQTEPLLDVRPSLGSWDIFQQALGSDFFDIQGGSTAQGVHLGAMGGTVDIVQRAYTGIVTKSDVLWINPRLPLELKRLTLNLHYRQQAVRLEITQQTIEVKTGHSSAAPIMIGIKNKTYEFESGKKKVFYIATGEQCQSLSSTSS